MNALALTLLLATVDAPTVPKPVARAPVDAAVTVTKPVGMTLKSTPDFRSTQPPPAAERAFVVPKIQTAVVPGTKLEVVLVEDHSLPAVQLRVVFPSGSIGDPTTKTGLSGICSRLVNEGTTRLAKVAWEEALADLAASVDVGAGVEQSYVSMRSLKDTWLPTLDLAVELVATPGLREDDLKRVRDRALAQLQQQKGSSAGIAQRLQSRVTWGSTHPLGALMTEATLGAVTTSDCAAMMAGWRPDGARVFVAGDVTMAEVKSALAERVQRFKWIGVAAKAPAVPAAVFANDIDKGTVVLVDVPGAEQTVVVVAAEGPNRQAADYDATSVMGAVLGGGFSSRINMNLREKHGYTYGARAGFSYLKGRGSFSTTASLRTDSTGKALDEIKNELTAMRAGPVTDVELGRERDGSLLAFPSSFATSSATLDSWSTLFFFGLPKDTLAKTPARLKALKKSDLEKAAKTRLPKSFRVLVVGDAARIAAEVEAHAQAGTFGRAGPVTVVDADGQPKAK
ncbi:MAG: pitrilysin family protein [Deltaproteobacteria bacterium]|nr:pitrilysin family protein [Deltaproteobacteria bacterium]